MGWHSVEVIASWEADGRFEPKQFIWQERIYRIESTGRSWEDEGGLHILCMVYDGKVFELMFRLNPASWWVHAPASSMEFA